MRNKDNKENKEYKEKKVKTYSMKLWTKEEEALLVEVITELDFELNMEKIEQVFKERAETC
jgi:hypothetical protein